MQYRLSLVDLLLASLIQVLNVDANPHAMITAAPKIPSHLASRQDSGPNVFGYIRGDLNSPLGCGAGYKWSALVTDYGLGACCNEVACTSIVAGCADGGTPSGCETEGCVGEYLTTISCDAPKPSCFRYLLMSNAQDVHPFYLFRCGTASTEIEVFAKAASGTNRAKTTQITTDGGRVSVLGSGIIQDQESGTVTDGTIIKATSQPTPTNDSPPSAGKDENNNTRLYITIGAVAGVVIIVASIVGGVCIYRRRTVTRDKLDAINLRDDISHLASDTATNDGRKRTSAWIGKLPGEGSSYGGNEHAYSGSSYGSSQVSGAGYVSVNRR